MARECTFSRASQSCLLSVTDSGFSPTLACLMELKDPRKGLLVDRKWKWSFIFEGEAICASIRRDSSFSLNTRSLDAARRWSFLIPDYLSPQSFVQRELVWFLVPLLDGALHWRVRLRFLQLLLRLGNHWYQQEKIVVRIFYWNQLLLAWVYFLHQQKRRMRPKQ